MTLSGQRTMGDRSPRPARRSCLRGLGVALFAGAVPGAFAQADAWPSKAVRVIVPYPPGGTSDAVARLLAEHLQGALGQPFVVENRAGASGNIGIDVLARSTPDGATLGFAAVSPLTLNPHLMRVSYDPLRDIVAVASVMVSPVYLVATPAFRGNSFADVLGQARARPGQVSVATSGLGSVGHVMLEQIARSAKVSFNHIPYKGGGQVATDAVGGQFELFTTNPSPGVNGLIAQGKLRVLAVAAPQRLSEFPDVSTFAELGLPEANLGSVFGVFAPGKTPAAVVHRVNAAINAVLAEKDVRDRLVRLDNVVVTGSAEQFANRIAREHEANARIVREAGIRPE